MSETQVWALSQEDPPEKEMATLLQYSCLPKSHGQKILAGYSPWGSKTVGHNLATKQSQYVE